MQEKIGKIASFILQKNKKYSILLMKFNKFLHAKGAQIISVQK